MQPKRVAVAGCRRTDESAPHDLYPDLDAPHLLQALRAAGATTTMTSWDDASMPWEQHTHVVISSTWDSVDHPVEYLAWARGVADVTSLVNPFALVAWNLDKTHHRDLAAAGIPTIPTDWVAPGDSWAPPGDHEFVVKPSVSAGGRSTVRYAAGDPSAADHVAALHRDGQIVMVQPYLEAIDTEGEVNIVLFDGEPSHAVRKQPALQTGVLPGERPWERMAWAGAVIPTEGEVDVARATVAAAHERCGVWPTYARVDLITGPSGAPTLLEVELIDPYLSLDMVPAAAARLADAILGTGRG